MPRTGLADPAPEPLRAALEGAETVARLHAKARVIPGHRGCMHCPGRAMDVSGWAAATAATSW
jgi:hypothetical protein